MSNPLITFYEVGLKKAIADIEKCELDLVNPKEVDSVDLEEVDTIEFWVEKVSFHKPTKADATPLTPRECRELGLMYSGSITGTFCYRIIKHRNGLAIPQRTNRMERKFGDMPIMVMSKACHLNGKTPAELVNMKEEVSIHACIKATALISSPFLTPRFATDRRHCPFNTIIIHSILSLVDIF